MSDSKQNTKRLQGPCIRVVCILLLLLLTGALLWFGNRNSAQAMPALVADVYFDGEYRIADGEWRPIVEGEHISSTQGDVTLRGNFHMLAPDGEYVGIYRGELPIAFYADHICLTFREGDGEPVMVEVEDPRYGTSSCGACWTAYAFTGDSEETVEILIHNPHSFGNETAIDEMLANMAFWTGIDFEKGIMSEGEIQRNTGLLLVLISLVFLGIALFSGLIHVRSSRIIGLLGLVVLFAGLYFAYSARGVAFWSESVVSNTIILGASMMFYMLFLSMTVVCLLKTTKRVGGITTLVMSVAMAVFLVLPVVSDVLFYDTWIWWIVLQLAANAVLAVCLVREFVLSDTRIKWLHMGAILPLLSFAVDVLGTWQGSWKGGVVSRYVFLVLLAVAVIMVLKLIPHSINAAAKANELEMEKIVLNAELAESRISTMMSQIRPHFIYNTLGSIEHLCKLDPPKAGELVHNFAKYLRGNFGELDNPKPILMSREMEHVRHYISIENVRFPDMTFAFEMNSRDFHIPALTIQPIVENAIKHGLMKLPKGGIIRVVSYETEEAYCISVEDDGVGFDVNALQDDRKHLGLRNIRERLKVMVGGTLEIQSTVGVGTKVLIKIPKEVEA